MQHTLDLGCCWLLPVLIKTLAIRVVAFSSAAPSLSSTGSVLL